MKRLRSETGPGQLAERDRQVQRQTPTVTVR